MFKTSSWVPGKGLSIRDYDCGDRWLNMFVNGSVTRGHLLLKIVMLEDGDHHRSRGLMHIGLFLSIELRKRNNEGL